MGYPAHWFSTLLSNLLSGKITTSARPPPIYKATTTQISTKPFLPDLEFAVAVYQPILPFLITYVFLFTSFIISLLFYHFSLITAFLFYFYVRL